MSILVEPPQLASAEPEEPLAADPEFWQCPECVYRIAYDFPGGWDEPAAAHGNAHRLAELGLVPLIRWEILRPGTPRR